MSECKDCSECFHYDVCGLSLMVNADECEDFLCNITCGICAHHHENGFCDLIRDTTDNDCFCHRAKRREEIMPRYIDANKLCEVCRNSVGKVVDCNDIMRIPLADVCEKKRGKWLHPSKNIAKCSECGCARDIRDQFGWNFYPVCGAKMGDE